MANRKKLLTSAIALGTAAALTLGGTFAWQSINQTALNESSDDVNPGGRLHDDFDGVNKDVYVENFADENIFARIRLTEYFEVVMNYGNEEAETVDTVIGIRGAESDNGDGTKDVERTGTVFKFDGRVSKAENGVITVNAGKDPAVTDSDYYWWTWTMGSEKSDTGYYMPTFNLNKDSLVADVNGKYKTPGVITSQNIGQYTDYHAYAKNETKAGTEIFDADRNQVDEVGSDFSAENLAEYVTAGNITLYNKLDEDGEPTYAEDGTGITHTAKEIGTSNGLISMSEWLALNGGVYSADTHGGYWVYDTDGWVYWSSPIAPDSTTGRLLDGIEMNHVMDDSWYYKLTVEGEFVTADDVGKDNNTGFYHDADEAPTESAVKLLTAIGVAFGGQNAGADDDKEDAGNDANPGGDNVDQGDTDDKNETEDKDQNTSDDNDDATAATTLTLKKSAGSTLTVEIGTWVTIKVDGVEKPLDGYSTTNSAASLFKVGDAEVGEATVNGNTETYEDNDSGWTLKLDYDAGTIIFTRNRPVTTDDALITYTKDGQVYVGSLTVTLPAAGPSGT